MLAMGYRYTDHFWLNPIVAQEGQPMSAETVRVLATFAAAWDKAFFQALPRSGRLWQQHNLAVKALRVKARENNYEEFELLPRIMYLPQVLHGEGTNFEVKHEETWPWTWLEMVAQLADESLDELLPDPQSRFDQCTFRVDPRKGRSPTGLEIPYVVLHRNDGKGFSLKPEWSSLKFQAHKCVPPDLPTEPPSGPRNSKGNLKFRTYREEFLGKLELRFKPNPQNLAESRPWEVPCKGGPWEVRRGPGPAPPPGCVPAPPPKAAAQLPCPPPTRPPPGAPAVAEAATSVPATAPAPAVAAPAPPAKARAAASADTARPPPGAPAVVEAATSVPATAPAPAVATPMTAVALGSSLHIGPTRAAFGGEDDASSAIEDVNDSRGRRGVQATVPPAQAPEVPVVAAEHAAAAESAVAAPRGTVPCSSGCGATQPSGASAEAAIHIPSVLTEVGENGDVSAELIRGNCDAVPGCDAPSSSPSSSQAVLATPLPTAVADGTADGFNGVFTPFEEKTRRKEEARMNRGA